MRELQDKQDDSKYRTAIARDVMLFIITGLGLIFCIMQFFDWPAWIQMN
jgi:hypothetical protein